MSDANALPPTGDEPPAGVFDYYSVPVWMMKGYLEQLGGREVRDGYLEGDGWQVALSAAPWRHIGSLRVGGTRAAFTGEVEVLEAFYIRLHQKTMRGGG